MSSEVQDIKSKFPEIWQLMTDKGMSFEQAKVIVESQKNEAKNSLKNKAESLFNQIQTDYSQDRDEIEKIKNQLFSAIEETYAIKQQGLLDIQQTKSEILDAIKGYFEERNNFVDQKMNVAIELIKFLTGLETEFRQGIAEMEKAYFKYVELQKQANAEINRYNEMGHKLNLDYNEAVKALNSRR